jgi:membrane protein implicated in regulation of membrane protease activity
MSYARFPPEPTLPQEDTVSVDGPFALVVVAFTTIALLMVLLMRVRLQRDPSRGWKPDQPPLRSLPRRYYVLLGLGYVVLAAGVALGIATHRPWPLVVAYVLFVASLVVRHVILYRHVERVRKRTGARAWRRASA